MNPRILFVDDDANVLASFQRNLRKQFVLETALGADQALQAISARGPYAVVVADMQMPGMNGVQLLSKIESLSPDTVRLMLTGNADQKTAMDAVNEGHVFRFLTKPCQPETLAKAINAGLEQYRLVTAERELLERTLNGSVKLLTDTLALTDAAAFGRAQKLRDSMRDFARHFNITQTWDLELAAMLSPIGYLALPPAVLLRSRENLTLTGQEKDMLARVPEIGANLLANIPRLEAVAGIVRYQLQNYDGTGHPSDGVSGDDLPIGARILKVLNDLLSFEERKSPRFKALEAMRQCPGVYDVKVLDAVAAFHELAIVREIAEQKPPRAITLKELRVHDRLASGIQTLDGTLIVAAETILTQMHMEKIRNFAELSGIHEPIYVAG